LRLNEITAARNYFKMHDDYGKGRTAAKGIDSVRRYHKTLSNRTRWLEEMVEGDMKYVTRS
jgi:hypothetical protein